MKGKKLYVIENQDGNIKIGVSKDVNTRIKAIKNQTGYSIANTFCTDICFNAFELEKIIHKMFEENRIFGEWFSVDFDLAKREVEKLFLEKAELEDCTPKSNFDIIAYFHPEINMRGEFEC